jgi:hypothetical protein
MNTFIVHWPQIINHSDLRSGLIRTHIDTFPIYDPLKKILHILIDEEQCNSNYERSNLLEIQKVVTKMTGEIVTCSYRKIKRKISISSVALRESVEFALNSLGHMTQKDFQNEAINKRTMEDYIIDTVRGKLAEYVFNEMYLGIENNYTFEIDNKIYKRTIETDNGNDLQIIYNVTNPSEKYVNNLKVDIKGSKANSQWLLVEEKKSFSDVYVFIKVNFVNEDFLPDNTIIKESLKDEEYKEQMLTELLNTFNGNYSGEVAGYVYNSDIVDPLTNKPWFELKSHHGLIKPSEFNKIFVQDPNKMSKLIEEHHQNLDKYIPELKAEINYGIPVRLLRGSLNEMVHLISKIKAVCIPVNESVLSNHYRTYMTNRSPEAIETRYQEVIEMINGGETR